MPPIAATRVQTSEIQDRMNASRAVGFLQHRSIADSRVGRGSKIETYSSRLRLRLIPSDCTRKARSKCFSSPLCGKGLPVVDNNMVRSRVGCMPSFGSSASEIFGKFHPDRGPTPLIRDAQEKRLSTTKSQDNKDTACTINLALLEQIARHLLQFL